MSHFTWILATSSQEISFYVLNSSATGAHTGHVGRKVRFGMQSPSSVLIHHHLPLTYPLVPPLPHAFRSSFPGRIKQCAGGSSIALQSDDVGKGPLLLVPAAGCGDAVAWRASPGVMDSREERETCHPWAALLHWAVAQCATWPGHHGEAFRKSN